MNGSGEVVRSHSDVVDEAGCGRDGEADVLLFLKIAVGGVGDFWIEIGCSGILCGWLLRGDRRAGGERDSAWVEQGGGETALKGERKEHDSENDKAEGEDKRKRVFADPGQDTIRPKHRENPIECLISL